MRGQKVLCPFSDAKFHASRCACAGTGLVMACDKCEGSGWNREKNEPCKRCHGRGAHPASKTGTTPS